MTYRYIINGSAHASLVQEAENDAFVAVADIKTVNLPADERRPPLAETVARITALLNGAEPTPQPVAVPAVVREALELAHQHWDDEPWRRRQMSNLAANALAALDQEQAKEKTSDE